MWKRRAASLPPWDRSARIWYSSRIEGATAMPSYDQNNIFARILRGELPCHNVYEDDKALALLDIMPRAPGHVLVLLKAPARNLLVVDPADPAHGTQFAQNVAKAIMTVGGADGMTLQVVNGRTGGHAACRP